VEDIYEILLTSIVHDPKQMELSVRRMIERRVDGVAILTLGMEESLLEHLRFRNVPLVFVDVGSDVPRGANIRINYRNGIRQAVQHLAALRHTHIAFVAGPRHLKSACSRRQAFEESMREAGLSPKLIVQGDHTVEGGMRGLENILQLPCNPTATMCSNDLTAIGVMQKAYSLDIRVPADLSVIGFDDIRLAQFVIPPLTTVQMSQTELATTAFRALMNEVTSDQAAHHRSEYRLDTGLLRRRTTAMAAP
jgi:LacI family transcriptional regulator